MNEIEDIAEIGRQMDRVVAEVAGLRADLAVLAARMEHLEGSMLSALRMIRELRQLA